MNLVSFGLVLLDLSTLLVALLVIATWALGLDCELLGLRVPQGPADSYHLPGEGGDSACLGHAWLWTGFLSVAGAGAVVKPEWV